MPFIVLEGLDGAGKSTQLDKLARFLGDSGMECEFMHFPRYDSPVYGALIARFLRGGMGELGQVDPYLVSLLYAGDRAGAAPMIRRWLDEGKWVVADRYVYSNVAYQCAKVDNEEEFNALKQWIIEFEFGYNNLPRPDISLFLDVPFGFVEAKLTGRREGGDRDYLDGGDDIHERSLDFQRRVRDAYLSCARTENDLEIIDCSDGRGDMDTPDNIFARIRARVGKLIRTEDD